MSSLLTNEEQSPVIRPRKRYKLYVEDPTCPIPIRTLDRWNKCIRDNINVTETNNRVIASEDNNSSNSTNTVDYECELSEDSENEWTSSSDNEDSTHSSTEQIVDNSEEEDCDNNELENDNYNQLGLNEGGDNQSINLNNRVQDVDENLCNLGNISNIMLYEGSKITLNEAVFDLLNLYVKHDLTKAALGEALKIQLKILPKNNLMPKTVYRLLQHVKQIAPPCTVTKHYYCNNCFEYIGSNIEILKCLICDAKKCEATFFFEFDICTQIKYLFEHYHLYEKLKPFVVRNDNVITDITDGSEYIRINSRPDRQKYDLTLIINTDGLSLIKSSKSHCWPLLCTIAELPVNVRESFVLNVGFWYSKEFKPSMNTFLRPLKSKLDNCFEKGVQWNHPITKEVITTKIVPSLIIADAPARAKLQNILNFNGRYGCNICEIRTKKSQTDVPGKRASRVYPYDINVKLRDGKRMISQARALRKLNRKHLRGVKGYSILSCFPLLDLGTCFIPEFMHSVLLGVTKRLFDIYINKSGPWSVKPFIKNIDEFILNIRPPLSFNRMPRSISESNIFKASEFYNLLLFYCLPGLKDFLLEKYFQHLMGLVIALFNLLMDYITEENLEESDKLLRMFVEDTPRLFDDKELTYNLHQLIHLVLSVKRWGPLSGSSAFTFENYNGFIAKKVHGTKYLSEEIANQVIIAQGVGILKNYLTQNNEHLKATEPAKDYQILGRKINITLSILENQLLDSRGIVKKDIHIYARANINKEIYTSDIYKEIKANSHNVQIITADNFNFYGLIKLFFIYENDLYFVLRKYIIDHTRIFMHNATKIKVKHIKPIILTEESLLIKVKDLLYISQLIKVGNFLCKRPNLLQQIW